MIYGHELNKQIFALWVIKMSIQQKRHNYAYYYSLSRKKKTNKKKKKSPIMLLRHKSEIAQQVVDLVNHHLG